MTSFNLAIEDKIVNINVKFGEDELNIAFHLGDSMNKFKRFVSSFIENDSCEIRITDDDAKDTDIYIKYGQMVDTSDPKYLCISYHNTTIKLSRSTVRNEFVKISELLTSTSS
jgi:hypothetical protein